MIRFAIRLHLVIREPVAPIITHETGSQVTIVLWRKAIIFRVIEKVLPIGSVPGFALGS